jgi:hypothetical protein
MTELAAVAQELLVDDDPAPDTGPEREHHERPRLSSGSHVELGERGGVAVVLELDRPQEPLLHHVPQRHLRQGNVHRAVHVPPSRVDSRRQAESDRAYRLVQELLDRGLELLDQRILRVPRRLAFTPVLDVSPLVDDPGQDLRAADIDADNAFGVRHAWLP